MEDITLKILYNSESRKFNINLNQKIGKIQENILSVCNLYIYAIENTKIIFDDDSKYILGDENMDFNIKFIDFLENEKKNEKIIKHFEVYDRKRDENGNVIKENKIIDKYQKYIQTQQNEEFIESFNMGINNQNRNINLFNENFFNNFISSSFMEINPNQLRNLQSIGRNNLPFNRLFQNNNNNIINNNININTILSNRINQNQNEKNDENNSDKLEEDTENDNDEENYNDEENDNHEENDNDEEEEDYDENSNPRSENIESNSIYLEFTIPQNIYNNLGNINSESNEEIEEQNSDNNNTNSSESIRINHIINNELNGIMNMVNNYVINYRESRNNINNNNNQNNNENNNNENNNIDEEINNESFDRAFANFETNLFNEINNPFSNININDEENNTTYESNESNESNESEEETKEDEQNNIEERPNRHTIHTTTRIFTSSINNQNIFNNNFRTYTRNYRPLRIPLGNSTTLLNNLGTVETLMTSIFGGGNFENFNYEDVKIVMTDEEFNKLEKINYNEKCLNEECCICMESFKEDEEVVKTPCEHNFHNECLKEWFLKESVKCPSCRKEVCKGTPKFN